MIKNKTQNTCQYCGKRGTTASMIHSRCAVEYLDSQGYAIMDFKLKRVLFGED